MSQWRLYPLAHFIFMIKHLYRAQFRVSQTPRHIWRNAEDTVALDEIFGMDDIAAADSVLVLFAEAQK